MSDDELRRRLQDIPGPRARLDADAAIAAAKRVRRPKTVALSAAATVAGVLIVAPMAMLGVQGLRSDSTAGSTSDVRAQPEPVQEPERAPDAASDSALAPRYCEPVHASVAGLALRFLDDPADGAAELELENLTDARVQVRLIETGSVELGGDGAVASAGALPEPLRSAQLPPGDGEVFALELPPRTACPAGAPVDRLLADAGPGIAPLASITITRDGAEEVVELVVVGEPFAVR